MMSQAADGPAQELPPAEVPQERQRYATGFASQDGAANGSVQREVVNDGAAQLPAQREERPRPDDDAARAQQPMPQAAPAQAFGPDRALPPVQRFELPVQDLVQVAQGSGLQWVNSDAEKIAAVQAAIAAEPKVIHVARERPSTQRVEDGPLVLVETKRDLREMTLPFEQQDKA